MQLYKVFVSADFCKYGRKNLHFFEIHYFRRKLSLEYRYDGSKTVEQRLARLRNALIAVKEEDLHNLFHFGSFTTFCIFLRNVERSCAQKQKLLNSYVRRLAFLCNLCVRIRSDQSLLNLLFVDFLLSAIVLFSFLGFCYLLATVFTVLLDIVL